MEYIMAALLDLQKAGRCVRDVCQDGTTSEMLKHISMRTTNDHDRMVDCSGCHLGDEIDWGRPLGVCLTQFSEFSEFSVNISVRRGSCPAGATPRRGLQAVGYWADFLCETSSAAKGVSLCGASSGDVHYGVNGVGSGYGHVHRIISARKCGLFAPEVDLPIAQILEACGHERSLFGGNADVVLSRDDCLPNCPAAYDAADAARSRQERICRAISWSDACFL